MHVRTQASAKCGNFPHQGVPSSQGAKAASVCSREKVGPDGPSCIDTRAYLEMRDLELQMLDGHGRVLCSMPLRAGQPPIQIGRAQYPMGPNSKRLSRAQALVSLDEHSRVTVEIGGSNSSFLGEACEAAAGGPQELHKGDRTTWPHHLAA